MLKMGKYILIVILIVAFSGAISFETVNILPTKQIFILLVFSLFIIGVLNTFKRGVYTIGKKKVVVIFIFFIYLFITFLNSVILHKVFFLDYLVAYLSFIYILILYSLHGKISINPKQFKQFYVILVFLFFFKYISSFLLCHIDRPGIFTENNYELLFLALISFAYYHKFKKIPKYLLIMLIIIFMIGSSRSGILILIVLLTFIYSNNLKGKHIFKICFFIMLSVFLLIIVLLKRHSTSIENIDRFRFLLIFIHEIRNWNLINFIMGKHPLTPLSYESCQALSFYKSLFSYSGKNICYAIILHMYILRVIFNHGFLGLISVFWAIYNILRFSGYTKKETIIIISFLIINGLSVSSVNSIFTILGLLILISVNNSVNNIFKSKILRIPKQDISNEM